MPRHRIPVPAIEYHVSDVCNLACQQCAHYSDIAPGGTVTAEEAVDEFTLWANRVVPAKFSLLGGEPTANPELCAIVTAAAAAWGRPPQRFQLVTNGFLLHRHPELPSLLAKHGMELTISVHHDAPAYHEAVAPVRKLVAEWGKAYPALRVTWRQSYVAWRQTYQQVDGVIMPFDSPPKEAWEHCESRYCTQLYKMRLWKCPPLAYFSNLERAKKLQDISAWDRFREYRSLPLSASDEEVVAFFKRREESACGLCAARRIPWKLPDPRKGLPTGS